MLVESIICSPTSSYPYHIAAKRYSVHHDRGMAGHRYGGCDRDLTLIFLHSTSFPKEIWEPTIENLLRGQNRRKPRIREAYAIDCPNHGVAAVLNDGLLGDSARMMKFRISLCQIAPSLTTAFFLQLRQNYLPSARCSFCSAALHIAHLSTFRNETS